MKIEKNQTPPLSVEPAAGSFRNPSNRVYILSGRQNEKPRILRGVDASTSAEMQALLQSDFFKGFLDKGLVVDTKMLAKNDPLASMVYDAGWKSVLEHEPVPFVTYMYEWTFQMLKDAALLHLRLLSKSLENGWTLKDSTPYNIQFIGNRPVFIDLPSFKPLAEGEGWLSYRQFCNMFLTPLLLRAHLGIDHSGLFKANLDGIAPTEAAKYFYGLKRFKKGVLSHILFPAKVEARILRQERDDAEASERVGRKQSKTMVLGLVDSMRRLIRSLKIDLEHTDWSDYDQTHTYNDQEHEAKKAFVEKHAASKVRNQVWDIGCNTGDFSRIAAQGDTYVIALDGDHNAIEKLYFRQKKEKNEKILPIVMNLSNMSPNHGWAGTERMAFDERTKPDLILALALIHHTRMSANIPNDMFIKWLHSTGADVILEFVDRHDEMVVKLLTNKKEKYEDYNLDQFRKDVDHYFQVADEEELKGGKRRILYLSPKKGV
jgi:SAM-dependent methyltransferase